MLKYQNKILCVHLHVLRAHKVVFRIKTIFYVAYVKMTKYSTKISHFMTYFFVFLHRLLKVSIFHETVHQHIEYGDVYANIFSNFFDILKFIPANGSICIQNH
jgi:hypothetical protein